MNVLYGLHQPDEGEILLDGEPVTIDSPRRAIGLGIGMVHQHFMLVPVMTVAENLVLGAEPHRGPLLDYKSGRRAHARAVGALRPGRRPRRARGGPRRRARSSGWRSCARCSAARRSSCSTSRPRCSPRRRRRSSSRCCARSRPRARASIFISHKLNEVLDVADRITVLRRGEKIDTVPTEGATERSLARLMVGRDVLLRVEKAAAQPGEPLLEVSDAVGPRRPRAARRARREPAGARGGDRRPGRRRRQRPERADRDDHRPAPARRGDDPRRAARDVTHAGPKETLARRRRPHRRGPPPARARARVRPRREPRAARVPRAGRCRASAGCRRAS